MTLPLSGVRVLDLSSVLMGPFCTQLLSDLGADVIKLEPLSGDTSRRIGPGRHEEMGSNFMNMNRGKRSICIDLKKDAGRELALRIAETSDVFVHNIRPAAMRRLGLDEIAVRRRNATILYCELVGFANGTSRAGQPAYDDLVQGLTGFSWLIAEASGKPGYVPTPIADRFSGLMAALGIVAGLFGRAQTVGSLQLSVPMYDVMAHMVLSDHMFGATFIPPEGEVGYDRLLSPERRPYQTLDGHVCVLLYTDEHWNRFFALNGMEEHGSDPRFSDMRSRNRNIDELNGIVAQTLQKRSTAEWLSLFRKADIPTAPMQGIKDLLTDPDLRLSGTLDSLEHPTEGRINVLNSPLKWGDMKRQTVAVAPRLGEHTDQILSEIGCTAKEIQEFASAEVTGK